MSEPLGVAACARHVLASLERGETATVVTLLEPLRPLPPRRLIAGGLRAGSLGDAALDAAVDALAAAGDGGTDGAGSDSGAPPARRVRLHDRDATVLLETHRPPHELVVVGAGHIAVPLAHMAAMADFRVCVLDDREAFVGPERFPPDARVAQVDFADDPFRGIALGPRAYVVLVTRAHRYDFDCLQRLLARDAPGPAYIGVIGSRRRIRAAFHALLEAGTDPARLACVRAPVGLDIGARTPAEIAVSVLAQMIAHRRMGARAATDAGRSIADVERVVERFFEATPADAF